MKLKKILSTFLAVAVAVTTVLPGAGALQVEAAAAKPIKTFSFENDLGGATARTANGDYNGTVTYGEGKFGRAIQMGNYGVDLNVNNIGDQVSVSLWMYRTANQGEFGSLVFMGDSNTWTSVAGEADGDYMCWTNGNGYEWTNVFSNVAVRNNEWTHVAVTQSGGTITLYVNGVAVANGTAGASLTNVGQDMFIGVNYWDDIFDGYIDEVQVYDEVLSASEVYGLYDTRDASELFAEGGFTVNDNLTVYATKSAALDVKLTAGVSDADAKMEFTSANKAVATVDAYGVVSGVTAGNTTITTKVTVGNVTKEATTAVTVRSLDELGFDLVADYNMTSASGATIPDASGNGNDATIVNVSGTSYVNDGDRTVLQINNANSYVTLPMGIYEDLTNKNQFTIETTYSRAANSGSNAWLFSIGSIAQGTGTNYIFFCPNFGGALRGGIKDNNETLLNFNRTLAAETYYTVVMVVDNGILSVYVDGVLISNVANTGKNVSSIITNGTANNILGFIGKSCWSADPNMLGKFDSFKIYDKALNAEEILLSNPAYEEILEKNLKSVLTEEAILGNHNKSLNEVRYDLNLIDEMDGLDITWNTSNASVIAKDGSVTNPSRDTDVTLTATVRNGSLAATVTFVVTVKTLDLSGLESVIAEAKALDPAAFTSGYEAVQAAVANVGDLSAIKTQQDALDIELRIRSAADKLVYADTYADPWDVIELAAPADLASYKPGDTATLFTVPNSVKGAVEVTYSSDNPAVATYENGVVTAKAEGTAILTATVTAKVDGWKMEYGTYVTVDQDAMPPEETEDILLHFTFSDKENGFKGGEAVAEPAGECVVVDGRTALYLDGTENNWLNVTKADGSSLLAGVEEMKVSFDIKTEGSNWPFYAAPSDAAQVYRSEKYLGVLAGAEFVVERYNSTEEDRPVFTPAALPLNEWAHVEITFNKTATTIVINNGTPVVQENMENLSELLGASPILYIGKANWIPVGSNVIGEYFKGYLDNYKIEEIITVDKSALESAVAAEKAAALVKDDYTSATWSVYAKALSDAEAVLVDNTASQNAVDQAVSALASAKAGLVKATVIEGDLLADFNFDADGTVFDGGYAQASGSYTLVDHADGKALKLDGNGQFLTVTKKDGTSLLTGFDELTVSFEFNPESSATNWGFFAAPNGNVQTYRNEKYLGIFDNNGAIGAERYNSNAMDRPAQPLSTVGYGNWYHVTAVYTATETILYVNGLEVAREASAVDISNLLGVDSVLYIGKSTWRETGEFYKGLIDNYKIYSRALTASEVAAEASNYLDKSELKAVVENAVPEADKDKYTPSTWEAYIEALNTAKEVLAKADATQTEINDAVTALTNVQNRLTEKADKTELESLVKDAKAIDTTKYTDDTVADLVKEIEDAENVLTNDNARQTAVDSALKQLQKAIDELEEIGTDDPTPTPNPTPTPLPKLPYVDVEETDWFYDEVAYTYWEGLMTGMDPTHFGPYNQLSRAQFALILYRIEGEPAVNTVKSFSDIAGDEWYGPAVLWAAEAGIVSGYTNGNFGPVDNITREQMSVMMYRYAKYLGKDVTAGGDYSNFKDAASVSEFAAEAMKWAVGHGIVTGKENGTMIDPQGNTARAEAAAIIQRYMNAYAE